MPRPHDCGKCKLCVLYDTRADYRAHWDGLASAVNNTVPPIPDVTSRRQATVSSANRLRVPCANLGQPTGKTTECGRCPKGRTALKVYSCSVHGECVLGAGNSEVHGCLGCADHVPLKAEVAECR